MSENGNRDRTNNVFQVLSLHPSGKEHIMNGFYNITISRQFGSLGRPIGMKLAQKLGIEFYDRDIIEEAAKRMDIALSDASDMEENEKQGFLYMKTPLRGRTTELKEELYNVERKIIIEWASKSSCVIVGRCSNYILRDDENHMNVFIYAPYEKRLENCVNQLGMNEEKARKMIMDVDRARDVYHKCFTRFKPADLTYNQVMFDSSMLGVDGTADAIAAVARLRFNLP